jgi:hypothetical protein
MIARLNWRRIRDHYPDIIRAAGVLLGAAGVVRLFLPVNYHVGDGIAECGPVISPKPSPYRDAVCSGMLDTAGLIAGLLIGLGTLVFALSWVLTFVRTRSARVHKINSLPSPQSPNPCGAVVGSRVAKRSYAVCRPTPCLPDSSATVSQLLGFPVHRSSTNS